MQEELTPSTAPLVYVEWEDIQSHEDWNEDSEADTTCTLKSVGWLIEDGPRKLVIAATYDYENEKWANKFAISKLPPSVIRLNVNEVSTECPAFLGEWSHTPPGTVYSGDSASVRHVPRKVED